MLPLPQSRWRETQWNEGCPSLCAFLWALFRCVARKLSRFERSPKRNPKFQLYFQETGPQKVGRPFRSSAGGTWRIHKAVHGTQRNNIFDFIFAPCISRTNVLIIPLSVDHYRDDLPDNSVSGWMWDDIKTVHYQTRQI